MLLEMLRWFQIYHHESYDYFIVGHQADRLWLFQTAMRVFMMISDKPSDNLRLVQNCHKTVCGDFRPVIRQAMTISDLRWSNSCWFQNIQQTICDYFRLIIRRALMISDLSLNRQLGFRHGHQTVFGYFGPLQKVYNDFRPSAGDGSLW